MRNKENIVWLNSWGELKESLTSTYDLSLTEACKLLKASRSWVNKYIRPLVPAVYISNGRGEKGVDYAFLMSLELGGEFKDLIWLDREAFYQLIERSVVCTAQTKVLPIVKLIPPDLVDEYKKECASITEAIKEVVEDGKDPSGLIEARNKLVVSCVKGNEEKALLNSRVFPDRRGGVEAVPVLTPSATNLVHYWTTVSERKGYGGIDEVIYRDLFKKGAHRAELRITTPTGETSKKIYYYDDPYYPSYYELEYGSVLIPYVKYRHWLDNKRAKV